MDTHGYYKLYKKYKLKYKNLHYGHGFGIDSMGDETDDVKEEKHGSIFSSDLDEKSKRLSKKQKLLKRDLENLEIINKVFSEYERLVKDPKLKLNSQMRDVFNVNNNPAYSHEDIIPTQLDPKQWSNLKKSFNDIGKSDKFNELTKNLSPSSIYGLLSKICIFSYADTYTAYFNHLDPKSDRSCITGSDQPEIYTKILLCTMLNEGGIKRGKEKTCETKGDKSHCHFSDALNICLPKGIKAQENPDKKRVLEHEHIPKLLYTTIQNLRNFSEADYIIGQFINMTQDKSNTILLYWQNILKISSEKLKNIKYQKNIFLNKHKNSEENDDTYKRNKIIYDEIITIIEDYIKAIKQLMGNLEAVNEKAIKDYTKKISESDHVGASFPRLIKINDDIYRVPKLLNKKRFYSSVLRDNVPIPKEIINIWSPMVNN